ncbi:hypothetical protein C8R42DRAFT_775135 [Lentinula raphanica]|nr:hypothetical protein C8R42DRAFT_775135 [Lentinula raphanica]
MTLTVFRGYPFLFAVPTFCSCSLLSWISPMLKLSMTMLIPFRTPIPPQTALKVMSMTHPPMLAPTFPTVPPIITPTTPILIINPQTTPIPITPVLQPMFPPIPRILSQIPDLYSDPMEGYFQKREKGAGEWLFASTVVEIISEPIVLGSGVKPLTPRMRRAPSNQMTRAPMEM